MQYVSRRHGLVEELPICSDVGSGLTEACAIGITVVSKNRGKLRASHAVVGHFEADGKLSNLSESRTRSCYEILVEL